MYEVVIVWNSGDTEVYAFDTEDKAEEIKQGFEKSVRRSALGVCKKKEGITYEEN